MLSRDRVSGPAEPSGRSRRSTRNTPGKLPNCDIAGGDWPRSARGPPLVKLCSQEEAAGIRVKRLGDIRAVFDAKNTDKLTTEEILEELVKIEDSPWAIW